MTADKQITLTRRDALKVGFLGGALVIAAPRRALAGMNDAQQARTALGPFVKIYTDNRIVINAPIPDMGTGVETALPMLVAEELDADWRTVEIERFPAAVLVDEESGSDRAIVSKYAHQGTGGSASVRMSWTVLRDCGAYARDLIVKAAAIDLGVPATALTTENANITNSTNGQTYPYGQFVETAAALANDSPIGLVRENIDGVRYRADVPPVSEGGPQRKPVGDFRIVGKPQRQKNLRAIIRGEETFGIDIDLPNQKFATIVRCPYFNGGVNSFDDSRARSVSGVVDVIEVPRVQIQGSTRPMTNAGVAVIATSLWAALKAREALTIEWDKGPATHESSDWHAEQEKSAAADNARERTVLHNAGDVDAALAGAARTLEASYTVPHFSHFNMEPLNCAAHVTTDQCIVATSHQNPAFSVSFIAKMTGLPPEKIEFRNGRVGCGLGRKWPNDFVAEAVNLSQMIGEPVKIFWTREDDIQNDLLNTSARFEFTAGFDDNNNLIAWRAVHAAQGGTHLRGFPTGLIADQHVETVRYPAETRLGAWRGPGNNVSGFAVEGFLNEIAAATDKDPLDMRLDLLGEDRELPFDDWVPMKAGTGISTRKMKGVLSLAAQRADWGAPIPDGWGRGIASHFTFGSYAAFVVDVSIDAERNLKLERVFAGVDCGFVVNPAGARAQIESGVNDGLSTALYQNVQIDGGRVVTDNFDQIHLMRINEAPHHIDVAFVESEEHPFGLGEIGLPAFIPALMAAIHDATGVRVRNLPIGEQLRA